jgi:hypothetical protein
MGAAHSGCQAPFFFDLLARPSWLSGSRMRVAMVSARAFFDLAESEGIPLLGKS